MRVRPGTFRGGDEGRKRGTCRLGMCRYAPPGKPSSLPHPLTLAADAGEGAQDGGVHGWWWLGFWLAGCGVCVGKV